MEPSHLVSLWLNLLFIYSTRTPPGIRRVKSKHSQAILVTVTLLAATSMEMKHTVQWNITHRRLMAVASNQTVLDPISKQFHANLENSWTTRVAATKSLLCVPSLKIQSQLWNTLCLRFNFFRTGRHNFKCRCSIKP